MPSYPDRGSAMIFNYYVIGKQGGFKRTNNLVGANIVPWPAQADRFYSSKLAERSCRSDLGEFVLGPYVHDDGGPNALVREDACPLCGAVPIKEEARNEEVSDISGD